MLAEAFIGGLIGLLFLLFALTIGVLLFVFWVWMLISAIQNKGLSEGEKIGWVLAIVFLHFLAALLYFFIGHPKRKMPLATG